MKVVSRTVRGNAGFSDVKTLTIRCWDFRTIRLIFMRKPQYLHSFYMPPDPGSMQSSPDSILASLQPSNAECVKDSSLPSTGSEGEGTDGETTGVMEMAFLWFSKIIFHSGHIPRSKTPQKYTTFSLWQRNVSHNGYCSKHANDRLIRFWSLLRIQIFFISRSCFEIFNIFLWADFNFEQRK